MKIKKIVLLAFLVFISSGIHAQTSDSSEYKLLIAAYDGNTKQLLQCLLDSTDVNCKTEEGITPLMYACEQGHAEIVSILLYNKANPNLIPLSGKTALISATVEQHYKIVESLILYGVDINQKDLHGNTALIYCAGYNAIPIAQLLLQKRAEMAIKSNDSTDALLIAVYFGNHEMVSLLLKNNCQLNTTDSKGHTPISVAITNGDKQMLDTLFKYGTSRNIQITNSRLHRLVDYAKVQNQTYLLKSLKSEKERGTFWPYFQKVSISYNPGSFSIEDYYMGLGAGVFDTKYGFHIETGFNERIAKKRILVRNDEQTYYQYWEKSRYFYLQADKCFDLSMANPRIRQGILVRMKITASFGKYIGSKQKPDEKFTVLPGLGYFLMDKNYFIKAAYEYGFIESNPNSPHWLSVSTGFFINFRKNLFKKAPYGF